MVPDACKGLLQVLYQRGLIDVSRSAKYRMKAPDAWKDTNEEIRSDMIDTANQTLLSRITEGCSDFASEITRLEWIAI